MGRMVTLTAEDGHTLAGYRAAPQGTARGGLVIVQEIFGVNSDIRRVTDGFAPTATWRSRRRSSIGPSRSS